jgi:hypothetical protein
MRLAASSGRGMITRIDYYNDRSEALKAVELEE